MKTSTKKKNPISQNDDIPTCNKNKIKLLG